MGINIDGARDLVSAGDGSLTIEGFSLNTSGIATFTGGVYVGTAATIFSNGNITDGIVTASAADLQTGPLNVGTAATISANGNATFAGIVTATSFATGGGNINLDDSGSANDDRIVFGAGSDLSIYHDGSNSYIDNAHSGGLYIRGGATTGWVVALQAKNSENSVVCTGDQGVDLYYNATKELSTEDGGVKLWGHSEQVVNALGNSTGTVTIDFTTANIITATLTGTTTFANPTTESVGQSGSIVITQDGTGSRTASWGSQFKWVGGTAPTLTTTAAAVDRIDYLVVAADTIHCVASLDVK